MSLGRPCQAESVSASHDHDQHPSRDHWSYDNYNNITVVQGLTVVGFTCTALHEKEEQMKEEKDGLKSLTPLCTSCSCSGLGLGFDMDMDLDFGTWADRTMLPSHVFLYHQALVDWVAW